MRYYLVLSLICLFANLYAQEDKVQVKLKKGEWKANMSLSEEHELPFKLIVEGNKINPSFYILNGTERVPLQLEMKSRDSLRITFSYFNTELVISSYKKRQVQGYWLNHNKNNYHIPFTAKPSKKTLFPVDQKKPAVSLAEKWEVTFDPGQENSWPAIGVFKQENENLSGTFLTETGDFRFLSGNISGDSLYLSGFDGSHAYLFKAKIKGDSIAGSFNSGTHYSCKWEGIKNDKAALTNPNELTYLVSKEPVTFQLPDLNNQLIEFPNEQFRGRVSIIQLMGTWCSNCMDESLYLKELYKNYHTSGLEIISVAYENGIGFEDYVRQVNRYKKQLDLPFLYLIGGSAKKNLASEQFPFLNEVISFPTTIIIDKKGKVRQIHTGFNGPGTGSLYKNHTEETDLLIKSLLEEN